MVYNSTYKLYSQYVTHTRTTHAYHKTEHCVPLRKLTNVGLQLKCLRQPIIHPASLYAGRHLIFIFNDAPSQASNVLGRQLYIYT
jgi:hypothetical protein